MYIIYIYHILYLSLYIFTSIHGFTAFHPRITGNGPPLATHFRTETYGFTSARQEAPSGPAQNGKNMGTVAWPSHPTYSTDG